MSVPRGVPARDVVEVTGRYEDWLRAQTAVVEEDLLRKHRLMRKSPFAFLRATFYLWVPAWRSAFPAEEKAPAVTAVGDLHMENFGTWRDAEGRLAFGVNDFDEAATLPYTSDLVRLATSALLAREDARLRAGASALAGAFLDTYEAGLRGAGQPILFAEGHRRLGKSVLRRLVHPGSFWEDALDEPAARRAAPADCESVLRAALPAGTLDVQISPRVAGMGSLGRPRFLAVGRWNGGHVAREAKARVPSAAPWAGAAPAAASGSAFDRLLGGAIRSRDPFLHTAGGWVVRRLAPDTDKIEIARLGRKLERELAAVMGREVANVHLATAGAAPAILADLERRPRRWLLDAAGTMAERMTACYQAWRKQGPR